MISILSVSAATIELMLFIAEFQFIDSNIRLGLQDAYLSATAVMSVLSVIGSILIIYFYWRMVEMRNKARKLLVYLSVCDLMIAFGNLIGIIW